jgi:hypothetical protein
LLLVAERGGDTMPPRIAIMRALNRHRDEPAPGFAEETRQALQDHAVKVKNRKHPAMSREILRGAPRCGPRSANTPSTSAMKLRRRAEWVYDELRKMIR